jgi:hypothetical protein
MELFYRLMGLTARASEGGSRYRVNAVGANWWFIVFFLVMACLGISQVVEALNNRGAPKPVSLGSVLTGALGDRYVAVKGLLDLDGSLSRQDEKEAEEVWVPLVDAAAKKAMYVKFGKGMDDAAMYRDGRFQGMVRPMPSELKSHVAQNAPRSNEIRLDDRYVIVAGERPARLWLWVALSALACVIALMIGMTIALRYVIFRRMEPDADAAAAAMDSGAGEAEKNVPIYASGVFRFNEKDRRRFLQLGAAVAEMASGDLALVTNVDASEKLFGQVTKDLTGTWALIMKAGSLGRCDFGRQYFGLGSRSAMRFDCIDAINGKSQRVVLSFDSDEDRARVRAELYDGVSAGASSS